MMHDEEAAGTRCPEVCRYISYKEE